MDYVANLTHTEIREAIREYVENRTGGVVPINGISVQIAGVEFTARARVQVKDRKPLKPVS